MCRRCQVAAAAGAILFAVATATPASAMQDSLPALQTILDRFIDAMGGREAIGQLASRRVAGHLVTELPSRQPPVHELSTFAAYATLPDRYAWIERSESTTVRSGSDGHVRWQAKNEDVRLDHGPSRDRVAWLLDPRGALRMADYFPEMAVTGVRSVADRRVYVVETDRAPAQNALFFDVESGLVVSIGYFWELQDFHEVDGVMFPGRIVISRKGGSSTVVFETVEHNVPVSDTLFRPPTRRDR